MPIQNIKIIPASSIYSLPNKLTTVRLVLAFVLFTLVWLQWWKSGLVIFLVAAFTDWLDGYLARSRNLTSALGRVYDPLVDKVLVTGTFIFLMREPAAALNAWMVTIIVSREFIVTGVRGYLEEKGVAFGADRLGKLKMVLQCIAIGWMLFTLEIGAAEKTFVSFLRDVFNWSTVVVTFISGGNYVRQALTHLE